MDVTGISVERAQAIEDASIVSGSVNGSGHLVLINGAGTEIDAGLVRDTLAAWPVGCLFTHTDSTNPNTLLGGGTWARFGEGRILISQTGADADFDTAGDTYGEKNHVLTAPEIPGHSHSGTTGNDSPDHGHTGTTTNAGNHQHTYAAGSGDRGVGDQNTTVPGNGPTQTGIAGDHAHTFTSNGANARHQHGFTTDGGTGGGGAHNNMPPVIVVYMWRRTA